PHRLVFRLVSGEYWLESTDNRQAVLGDRLVDGDPLPRGEEERKAEHDERFAQYEDLAGETFRDPETDEKIPPVSPVLKAKDALLGPAWSPVDNLEWQKRSLGNYLMIKD